ncbi:hypothetical protein ACSHWO_03225 [Streptomyces sp. HUAS TT3]|uniref:hypothetical protein n=1 Tax=Streptomyces sp. HUAS TT3 TaxID=3447510 RepID=UPI003F6595E2
MSTGRRALAAHLRVRPDGLAWPTQPSDGPTAAHWQDWSTALVEAGQRLGFIRTDGDRSLLATATAAVVRAADEWALAGLRAQQPQAQPQAADGERVPDGGRGRQGGLPDGGQA